MTPDSTRTRTAQRRTMVVVGVAFTAITFLMAFGVLPAVRWPRIGRAPAGTPAVVARADSCMRDALRVIAAARDAARPRGTADDRSDADALVGSEWTPLVTTLGSLEAKRLASSPAWAAVLSAQILSHGIRASDFAAASFSGSFPGLNIATICACRAAGVPLVAFSSVTASTWGATEAGFTWPELELILVRAGVIEPVSISVSAGGDGDRGLDLDDDGRRLAEAIAGRTSLALGATWLRAESLEDAIQQRLRLLDRAAQGRPVALFVNVGGTSTSLGTSPAILRLRSGWLPPEPFDLGPGRGLIARALERGVPVLHLLNIRDLAARWGIM